MTPSGIERETVTSDELPFVGRPRLLLALAALSG